MSQADQQVQNAAFPAVRTDINDNLAALFSQSSGASAPAVTVAFQPWIDTSSSPAVWKVRNGTNNGWITIGTIDATTFNTGGITAIANGGTGQTTATAALAALLPSQAGNSGKALVTDGSLAAWGLVASIASRSDVNGVHTTGTVTSGTTSLIVASATGIVAGMVVTGEGITPGTTVSSIASTTVTLSANAGATLSADPVGFYDNTKSLSPGSVGGQLCRAWVNFNGTGTVAIRASYNVSSITDNGVGDYTVNFTTAMPDANYSLTGTCNLNVTGGMNRIIAFPYASAPTTSAARIASIYSFNNILEDSAYIQVAIFR